MAGGDESKMTNKRNCKRRRLPRRVHTIHIVDGQPVNIPDVPGLDPEDLPFMGEMMTCVMCGATRRSDPHVESQWRGIQLDEKRYYACPAEFPPDGSSTEAFKVAYLRVMNKIMVLRGLTND